RMTGVHANRYGSGCLSPKSFHCGSGCLHDHPENPEREAGGTWRFPGAGKDSDLLADWTPARGRQPWPPSTSPADLSVTVPARPRTRTGRAGETSHITPTIL